MKLLFSEHKADHAHYIYPYAIWAFPEAGETPGDLFNQGFLPSSRNLDRFYLCRQLRVNLGAFAPSSENRRILRKGEGITFKLIPREEFDYTPERREFYKQYADVRFGKETMGYERLDSLFNSKVTSHLMVFTETSTGAELGTVTLYLEEKRLAFYYYAFYDLNHFNRSLGLFMMTSAVKFFAEQGFEFIHLGSCYSQAALYKTQFAGVVFFNGVKWSGNLEELKYLLNRETKEVTQHLLETAEYRQLFYEGELDKAVSSSQFRVTISPASAKPSPC
jgi:arginyl-tRNA--protein-N-Asp/Glu arginylyltransferase